MAQLVKFDCPKCASLVLTTGGIGEVVRCGWCGSPVAIAGATPFTEQDWLSHTDPFLLLQFARSHVSDRKLWLFCYACARRILERVLDGVEQGERRVGSSTKWARSAFAAARRLEEVPHFLNGGSENESWSGGRLRLIDVAAAVWGPENGGVEQADVDAQMALLRDVVGNPFRPVTIPDAVQAWDGGAVVKLAQAIHDGRTFADLPVLADALEDAGCSDDAILSHLRSAGPHVRGCWALDALLGRA
jgi:hypothetical protein